MDNNTVVEIEVEVDKALNKLIFMIQNEEYFYYQTLIDKQELAMQYDSQIVDDICEYASIKINNYLITNNIMGFVENGYNEVTVVI